MIEEKYPGESAVLFATGPSLTVEAVELVRPYHKQGKLKTFGCNDSYKIIDYLDVMYACDKQWWQIHIEDVFKECKAELWTQEISLGNKYEQINYTPGKYEKGLSLDPKIIHYGSNSGYQMLNLAYLMGVRNFLLVGYNMGAGGHTHFFGDHPKGLNRNSPYERFIQAYNTIQPEIAVNIINCTKPTALKTFKKMTLKEALKQYD